MNNRRYTINVRVEPTNPSLFPNETESVEFVIEDAIRATLQDIFGSVTINKISITPSPEHPTTTFDLTAGPLKTDIIAKYSGSIEEAVKSDIDKKLAKAAVPAKIATVKVDNTLLDASRTIRLGVFEEPLTALNLSNLISAMTGLHTKCWLITQGRLTDLIEYSQTHNQRFIEEANLTIGKISHNSPAWLDFILTHGPSITEAIKTATTIVQTPFHLQAAELENEAKALETKLKEQSVKSDLADKKQARKLEAQKAEIEHQQMELELEKTRLEIKRQQMDLQEKRLELERKRLEYEQKRIEIAFEIAGKTVNELQLNVDEATRAMFAQILLPEILQLGKAKKVEIIQLTEQSNVQKTTQQRKPKKGRDINKQNL